MRAKTKKSRLSWHRAMLWYERVVHDKILRSRPPHPQGTRRYRAGFPTSNGRFEVINPRAAWTEEYAFRKNGHFEV